DALGDDPTERAQIGETLELLAITKGPRRGYHRISVLDASEGDPHIDCRSWHARAILPRGRGSCNGPRDGFGIEGKSRAGHRRDPGARPTDCGDARQRRPP